MILLTFFTKSYGEGAIIVSTQRNWGWGKMEKSLNLSKMGGGGGRQWKASKRACGLKLLNSIESEKELLPQDDICWKLKWTGQPRTPRLMDL